MSKDLVQSEVIELVAAREAEIKSGVRKVAVDESEPKSTK